MIEPGLLERMEAASRARVEAARRREPEGALLARASVTADPPALRLSSFDVIAELKQRSPAAGRLAHEGFDFEGQLQRYARAGAAAVSVLTEPEEFQGALEHLERAAVLLAPLGVPVMRKDFLTAPYQVLEARAAGAAGVLIIVAMLSDRDLDALLACAQECGLFALLEAFDADDLERIAAAAAVRPALEHAPILVGVNSRDLRTLAVDFGRFAALAPHLPRGLPAVAESGIGQIEQLREVADLGYSLALVGSTLMQAEDPEATLAGFLAAGRACMRRGRACS
ncbi:MAG TPA: indole-3-glycerol-phosphate synthase [Gammaproteobacteria bacterium]|jgi:indole-3-glycerol phosphate synthase